MTKRENRDTYLPQSKAIARTIDTSDKIAAYLSHLREQADDERIQLHLVTLVGLQKNLSHRIRDYLEMSPWQVTDTFAQYVDEGSGKVDDMIREQGELRSMNDVTLAALSLNNEMAEELESLSLNQGVEETREAFENLQFLIRDTCRKISMERSQVRDV